MFIITKYEHEFLEEEKQFIKIHFTYIGDDNRQVKVKVFENLTNARWQVIGGIIPVKKNHNYWVSDITEFKFEIMYNNDLIVGFFDNHSGEILYEQKIITSGVNINKRSLGADFSKKNIWIIGDSHTNHFLSYNISYDFKNYETNNAIINPVALPLLSINRFINSDYLKLFRNLPIFDGDDICLFFGEIDTRVGIIRNSTLKNITYIDHTINLINRFIKVVEEIKNKYDKCNFFYILPNPPVMDGWITSEKKIIALQESDEKTRFLVRYCFEEVIIEKMNQIDVKVIDLYKNYLNSRGFVDDKFLIEDDHHFKTPNDYLDNLKKYF